MTRGVRSAAWLFGTAAAVFGLDRLTKLWAEHALEGRPPVELLPGVRLAFTTNPGGAFSIGGSAPLVFVTATVLVAAVIVATAARHERVLTSVVDLGYNFGRARVGFNVVYRQRTPDGAAPGRQYERFQAGATMLYVF